VSKKQLQKLTQLWYKKLASKGFKDLEDSQGNLKQYSYKVIEAYNEYTQTYYERARALLHTKYLKGRDKQIWAYHSEGMDFTQIGKKVGLEENRVREIVHDIARKYVTDN